MVIDKSVQDEIGNFAAGLSCDKKQREQGMLCLPLYLFESHVSRKNYTADHVRNIINKGVSLYNKLTEERKKEFFDDIYGMIYQDMKEVLFKGETNVNHDCNVPDCSVYSVLREAGHGSKLKEYLSSQEGAIDVFKWKRSQDKGQDIGFDAAGII